MGSCSLGTVTLTSPWLARLARRPLPSLGALDEVDTLRLRPVLRGEGFFWETMVWLRFPIRTCSVFLVLEAPLRLLDLEDVEARPSSDG